MTSPVFQPIDDVLLDIVNLKPSLLILSEGQPITMINPADADAFELTPLVQYSSEGVPEDVRMTTLLMYLLPVIRTYRDEIRLLKERVSALEDQITSSS